MHIEVRCPTCQREERWTGTPEQVEVEVCVDGGGRRTAEHPQWARGKAALAALAKETGPVVGMCSACGQLLVARDPETSWPVMRVRIDTPSGALEIHEAIRGPNGESWTREEAEAFLSRTYHVPITKGLAGDVGRSAMVISLLLPFTVAWILAGLFVLSFLSAVFEGPAPTMRSPGFDLEEPAE